MLTTDGRGVRVRAVLCCFIKLTLCQTPFGLQSLGQARFTKRPEGMNGISINSAVFTEMCLWSEEKFTKLKKIETCTTQWFDVNVWVDRFIFTNLRNNVIAFENLVLMLRLPPTIKNIFLVNVCIHKSQYIWEKCRRRHFLRSLLTV